MTLRQLKYAVELQRFGHYRLAAKKLGISQPALSIQIQGLESEVGLKLFDRRTSPVTATYDGTHFLKKAEEILANTEKLGRFADEVKNDFSGELRIGIIPTVAPYLVPLFTPGLQKDHPEFKLDFHEALTEEIIRELKSGQLDLGILSTPVQSQGIVNRPLFYEKFYFYYSRDYNPEMVTVKSLDYSEFWLLEEGNCFRDQISNFCNIQTLHHDKKFNYRTNSVDVLIKIVDNNGGITILPELSTITLNSEQEERIKQIGQKPKAREIGLVLTQNFAKKRFVDKICEYILNNIPSHMLEKKSYQVIDPEISIS